MRRSPSCCGGSDDSLWRLVAAAGASVPTQRADKGERGLRPIGPHGRDRTIPNEGGKQ